MNMLKSLFGGDGTSLNASEAKARLDARAALFILDVRQPGEFRNGHLNGATLIPLNELEQRMTELPKDTEILCVCQSGSRSGMATGQLRRAGYSVINLRGGMIGWQMAGYPVQKGS